MIVCNNIQEGTESEKTKSFSEDINIDTTQQTIALMDG